MAAKKKVDPKSPFAKLEAVREELRAKEEKEKAAKGGGPAAKGVPKAVVTKGAPPRSSWESKEAKDQGGADADAMAFHRLVSGVTPLGDAGKSRIPRSQSGLEAREAADAARLRAEANVAARAEDDAVMAHLRSLVEGGGSRFEVTDDGRRVEGRRDDVTPAALRSLRRGQMPVDATLDLHGLRAGEARDAIVAFLRDQRVRGERCVLVIHGKGTHSPASAPVLRGEVAAWLSQGAASEHVAAFATAGDEHGGEGAVYVLLRK